MPAPEVRLDVGGQAVIEGVMMRSPRSFAVVCRRPTGEIVIKEDAWQPVWGGVRFLRWPLLRGGIVLFESLLNGFSALSFSAEQQVIEPEPRAGERGAVSASMALVLALSLAFGLALFVGVPHLLAWALGDLFGFDVTSLSFHLVDGIIKVAVLLGYLAAISLLPDVRRVFAYHGAEHKAIYTYEKGLDLTVANARVQSRFHPRCGTSFLFIVVGVSVVIFAAALRGRLAEPAALDHALKILIKLPLMLPVAGLAYELLRLTGRIAERSRAARALAAPGLWLQRITTREPDDAQLEIALIALKKTLWRERVGAEAPGSVEVHAASAPLLA